MRFKLAPLLLGLCLISGFFFAYFQARNGIEIWGMKSYEMKVASYYVTTLKTATESEYVTIVGYGTTSVVLSTSVVTQTQTLTTSQTYFVSTTQLTTGTITTTQTYTSIVSTLTTGTTFTTGTTLTTGTVTTTSTVTTTGTATSTIVTTSTGTTTITNTGSTPTEMMMTYSIAGDGSSATYSGYLRVAGTDVGIANAEIHLAMRYQSPSDPWGVLRTTTATTVTNAEGYFTYKLATNGRDGGAVFYGNSLYRGCSVSGVLTGHYQLLPNDLFNVFLGAGNDVYIDINIVWWIVLVSGVICSVYSMKKGDELKG